MNTKEQLAIELAAIAGGGRDHPSLAWRLEAGEAMAVAQQCLSQGSLSPELCSLVLADSFQTRLGAMVALEEIASRSPDLAARAAAGMTHLLTDAEPRNRGDVAFMLGRLGRPEVIPQLERLLADPDPSVADAAQEAAMRLKKSPR
ncbi:MAG: HEAT repeat domain-containing protein [Pseudomonadota bacterium]